MEFTRVLFEFIVIGVECGLVFYIQLVKIAFKARKRIFNLMANWVHIFRYAILDQLRGHFDGILRVLS